ncbi:MAG TPA: hypothetical protein O0W90_00115, partial [Methanocorpusculum sp.]|nr:hypothetical protein [Methanocorpusculum sp.]
MKRNFCNRYIKLPLKAILLSLLIIFVCASAFCGCVSAEDVTVGNWNDLKAALEDQSGDKTVVELSGNINDTDGIGYNVDPSNIIVINKTKTLNLKGHTINISETTEASQGSFTINNRGNLTVTGNGKIECNARIFIVENGTLILESGTFNNTRASENDGRTSMIRIVGLKEDTKSKYSVFTLGKDATLSNANWAVGIFHSSNEGQGYGVVVDISGKILSMEGVVNSSGISINGQLKPTSINEKVPQIHIHDGAEINTPNGCSVYGAGYGNWTFDKECKITGSEVLSIKSGNWTINGGKFEATGEYCDPAIANGDGTEPTGAAVSITHGGKTAYSYIGKVELIIKDGTFISKNQSALFEGKNNKPASKSALSDNGITITGGEFITKNSSKLYPIHIMNLLNKPVNVNTGNNIQLYPNFNLTAANWTKADD